MDRSSIRRVLQRCAAAFVAAAAVAAPVVVTAADYTLAAPAPATVTAGSTGMVTIHVKLTPPNNAVGTKAAPTGFMTVVRQGDTDPTWCYPNTGTLCYTGALANGGVDVHVNVSKLAAAPGTLLFQLRDPSTKGTYSNALAVQVVANPAAAVSGSHVTNPGAFKTAPTPGAPMAIHALTLSERKSLPDDTKFSIRGRVVSLGQLREAHKMRLQRATSAAADGRAARLALNSKYVMRSGPPPSSKGGSTTVHAVVIATATPFPTQLLVGALTLSPVPQKASDLANVPHDMFEFCTAAAATVCLYLPPDVYFLAGPASLASYDPLIDQPTCTTLRGTWGPPILGGLFGGSDVCRFVYPTRDVTSFVPGASPTFNYAFSDSCKPKFETIFDQKGALSIAFPQSDTFATQYDAPQSCLGYAYVK